LNGFLRKGACVFISETRKELKPLEHGRVEVVAMVLCDGEDERLLLVQSRVRLELVERAQVEDDGLVQGVEWVLPVKK